MAAVIIVALVVWCVCAVLVGPVVGGHLKRQAERQFTEEEPHGDELDT